ncbi:hypothetical protein AB0M87_08340 [Streptomyces sp. NPDC051320]|uniref:hypothetical protein n=1 Tax=Streptomyces sp. NPDC051320 TaxID=3154644 RepID=UPI003419E5BD
MRWTSIGSAALLSVAAISLAAPAATAGDDSGITSFGYTATPASVAPGGTVTLTVTGCDAPGVTVTSGVFDTVTVKKGKPAKTVVDPEAKPGVPYDITFDCDGETGTTPLTVTTGKGDETGKPDQHGKGDETGKPDQYGKGDETGKPDQYGQGDETGKPDQYGQGDETGWGNQTGRPEGAGAADKGVNAGLGGSITGTNPSELVAGGVLIAAALGGVLHLRRRALRDRT